MPIRLDEAQGRNVIALLWAIEDGEVWHYFESGGRTADIDHRRQRMVSTLVWKLQREGWAKMERRPPGAPRRQRWTLTDSGRAVLVASKEATG